MTDEVVPVTVRILEKEFKISCPEGEEAALQNTVRYLNKKMREIRESGNIVGTDRIAMMAALNIAHELLQQGEPGNVPTIGVKSAKGLQSKLEIALNRFKQMEL